MSSFAESMSSRTSQRLSDQNFEVLECKDNKFNIDENRSSLNECKSNKSWKNSATSIGIQTIQFVDITQQKKQKKDEKTQINHCQQCSYLSLQMQKIRIEKEGLERKLRKLSKDIEMRQNEIKALKIVNIDPNKQQHNYYVSSLRQIIHSYDQEQKNIINFVINAIGMKPKNYNPKSLKQLIQSVITQMISNWRQYTHQILEIQNIMKINSKNASISLQKYNHYLTLRQIENIKTKMQQINL